MRKSILLGLLIAHSIFGFGQNSEHSLESCNTHTEVIGSVIETSLSLMKNVNSTIIAFFEIEPEFV
jgi:hypothetical protein